MKVDWKHLASTEGYMSLKAAYAKDVSEAAKLKRPMRDKAEFLRHFTWVIARAKHYAHHTGRTIESVLNEWEERRSYWWLGYYQDAQQPKFHSGALKPRGVNGLRKYYKRTGWPGKERICSFMQDEQKKNSVKEPKRWPMSRKKRGY